MADSKITALTSIGTSTDPANDPLVIVDVSDTSMAATGTTKKVTLNNLLACSPTATLASATITGDLTVDTSTLKVDSTNNRVGIVNASPSFPLDLTGTGSNTPFRLLSGSGTSIRFDTTRNVGAVNRNWILGCDETAEGSFALIPSTALGGATFTNPVYRVTAAGVHTFFDGAGGTYATLNSTGLGVGTVPANGIKLATYVTTAGGPATSGTTQSAGSLRIGAASTNGIMDMGTAGSYSWIQPTNASNLATNYDLVLNPNGGNVGVGVTPSAWGGNTKAMQLGDYAAIFSNTANGSANISMNASFDGTNWKYKNSNWPANYSSQINGQHQWWNAPSSGAGGAGTTATFTQAMTLDASGNLLVGTTSTAGSSSNATALVLGGARTANGSVSATTAVATTIFSITAALTGRYEVVALIGFSGAPAQYTAIATIIWDGNGSRVVANNGANLTITISGSNVQITQTSGSTQTVSWSFLRIAL